MSAEYDFYKNPIPKGSNRKPRLHARIVPRGVITTEMLSEEIHDASLSLIHISEPTRP